MKNDNKLNNRFSSGLAINTRKPREFINPLLSKKSISPAKFEQFKANFLKYRAEIDAQHASKQSEPNIVSNALKPFIESLDFTTNVYSQKGQSGIDLVILNNNIPAVILEAKRYGSADMISGTNINTKAFHESVLYFMRERANGNQMLCHVVITDFYSWFVFDAKDFDRLFWKNSTIRNLYKVHINPSLLGDTTKDFYEQLQKAIEEFKFDLLEGEQIECAYFETKSTKTDKDLLALFKLLSADCLTKSFNPNDANRLNREFYNELLYILGLEEDGKQKKMIRRAKETQIGTLFENITNKLNQHDKRSDFETVIKLIIIWINRILFLKLLESQIAKWTKNTQNKFLNKEKIPTYSVLEELFFEVLAKPVEKRKSNVFDYIPYLNSSLFEINPEEKSGITIGLLSSQAQITYYSKTIIKNDRFQRKSGSVNTLDYLFEFLNAYDFGSDSTDEIGDDSKPLMSASVLGLIFEKINGYKDGSFYTPSFVTMLMARQLLQKTVLERFKLEFEDLKNATWTELKRYCDKHSHMEDFSKRAIKAIDTITICDPAVGSGHYLVSVLNEIIFIKYELGLFVQKGMRLDLANDELHISLDDEWFEYKRPTHFNNANHLLQKSLFTEKQRIIENQLFGVDINPNSTQITKLRLWIELLKHSYYDEQYQLVTLPNIDINIKTGNSVVRRFGLTDDIKDENIKAEISNYKEKVKEYKESVGSKHEVMSVILRIKDRFKQTLKARHSKNKALANKLIEYVDFFGYQNLEKDLRVRAVDAKHGQGDMFGADNEIAKKNKGKQTEIIAKVKKLHEQVLAMENGEIYLDAFEWRFEFPEVLDENGEFIGFDAVIANPPYIDSEAMVKEGHGNLREYLKENYRCTIGNWDLYIVFMELAMSITKKSGTMSYITPDKWLSKPFGNEFRIQYIEGFQHVITLGRDVFDNALVDSIITQISHVPTPTLSAASLTNGSITEINRVLKADLTTPYYLDPLLSSHFGFINRLEKNTKRLNTIIVCESACATSDAYKLKPFVVECNGGFNPKNHYIMMNTGTLGKYVSRWGVKPMTYLKKKYLRPIVNRVEFSENFQNTYKTKSDAKKIIVKGLTLLDATLDLRGEVIPGKTTLVLPSKDEGILKYVCAILNSPLSIFYIKARYGSASYNGGINFTKEMLNTLPIPAGPINEIIISLVDQILALKTGNHEEDISNLESEINSHIYSLYELSPDEIDMIEGVSREILVQDASQEVLTN